MPEPLPKNLLFLPDGKSVFKIYSISITGRDKPELYEWEHSPFTQLDFEQFFFPAPMKA